MSALFRNSLLKIPSTTKWNILDKILSQSVQITHNKLYIFSEERVHPDIISKIYKYHGSLEPFILCCGLELHEYTHIEDIDLFLSPYEDDSNYLMDLQSKILHWKKTKFMHLDVNLEAERPEKYVGSQRIFKYGVLGGTFDNLHKGHKLLLTTASAICSDKLLLGITHEDLLIKKKLAELLQPYDVRQSIIREFLQIINPQLSVETVAISDPIGPSGTDPDLDVLIVSKETEGGIKMVNDARQNRGLNTLNSCIVDLIFPESGCDKMSSSSCRKELLGSQIDHGDIPWLRRKNGKTNLKPGKMPYVIGLTGGICSGKSTISEYLKTKNIPSIDCDKIGHLTYEPGATAYNKIVSEFGQDVLDENGVINRRALGTIVFSDPKKLTLLNEIVWPCIADMVQEEIERSEAEVIVVEAAVMLEAGWQSFVDEVWVMTVSPNEAVTRLSTRNKLSTDEAAKRLSSQMSNTMRCSQADIVICSDWEVETTRSFMDKAWQGLQNRLQYYKICQHSGSPYERWNYLLNNPGKGWPEEHCRSEKSRSFLDIALSSVDETLHLANGKWDVLYAAFFFLATTLHVQNSSMRAYEAMFKMFRDGNSLPSDLADEIMENIKLLKSMETKCVPCTQFNLLFCDIWRKANIFSADEGDQRILPSISTVDDINKERNCAKVELIVGLLESDKHIFKTDYFYKTCENEARCKLRSDLEILIVKCGSNISDEVKSRISGHSPMEY